MKRLNFVVWMVVLLLFTAPTMEINADTAPARVEMTVPGLRKSRPAKRPGIERAPPPAQLPRVTRLMALAIKYQGMISRGEVLDYADIARLGYVTRARVTQVMNLLHLTPDIQEELLFAQSRAAGPPMVERDLRTIARQVYWRDQRSLWRRQQRSGR
jgi:hypothetical protein